MLARSGPPLSNVHLSSPSSCSRHTCLSSQPSVSASMAVVAIANTPTLRQWTTPWSVRSSYGRSPQDKHPSYHLHTRGTTYDRTASRAYSRHHVRTRCAPKRAAGVNRSRPPHAFRGGDPGAPHPVRWRASCPTGGRLVVPARCPALPARFPQQYAGRLLATSPSSGSRSTKSYLGAGQECWVT